MGILPQLYSNKGKIGSRSAFAGRVQTLDELERSGKGEESELET